MKSALIIFVDLPAGVSLGEFASHVSDGSLLLAASYDATDPMSRMGPIEVFGAVPSAELPPAGG